MQKKPRGKVRIIGGQWRGRLLAVPAVSAIRPTPDRVRETVFNWLQGYLAGARVLDLYAGTGVLGLEALSRGAQHATFIEQNGVAARALSHQLGVFQAVDRAQVHMTSVLDAGVFLTGLRFDVVFIDPPYDASLLVDTLTWLDTIGCLAPDALIYVEQHRKAREPLPAHLGVYKHRTYGTVDYMLLQREG
jgi:16S rRNA (guanine966-N2)-methyltransferase